MAAMNENMQQANGTGGQDEVFVIPASFAQQRLWFVDQLDGASNTYNILYTYRLQGTLDVSHLQNSLQAIVDRHESLRTTFGARDGAAMQVVRADLAVALEVTDLSEHSETEREERLQRLVTAANRPFDLGKGPLFSFHLVQLSAFEHVLIVNMHHIISDGWSMGVFARELAAFYEAFATGREVELPELPLQYADFSMWQREWMQGEVLEEQLGYWKEKLRGELPVIQLPLARPRPPKQTYNGRTKRFALSSDLSAALKSLCHAEGTTLNMALLAAYKTLLHRYTGLDDILVGAPVAGRNQEEIGDLIGFFVNTQVLRTDLSDAPTFRELLGRVRQTVVEAIDRQDVPFEKLVEELQPQRDLSRSPLVQVMFAFENFETSSSAGFAFAGLQMTAQPMETGVSKFDLTLYMGDAGDSLYARLEYNTDLYDESMIDRFMSHLTTFLESVVANPNQSISHVQIIGEAERQQLLGEWKDTTTDFWQGKSSLQELFEAQVERAPEAVALVFEGRSLTYQELNERANRLAHHLQKRGVGPEQMVGLCVERSLEMIVGLLGILKAGGTYLPLDPSYPADRLAFAIEDSQVGVVLTQEHLLGSVPFGQAQAVCLDRDWAKIARENGDNPQSGATAESLAYVIYTSGSTGKPKGVLIPHGHVMRLFASTDRWYGFNETDVWTLFHSYAFDFSVWEIWGALLYGGKLVVVPYLVSRSPQEFYRLLVQEQVTVLNQTPSAFRQLIQVEELEGAVAELSLRYVIFGGEALELQSLKPWYDRHGDQQPQLVNMYGITETTVHVTYRPLSMEDLRTGSGSVIGVAIPDLQVYVLDKHLQPVPLGVIGEMYVGGSGVARGYLNRPELTAERFLQNPFVENANARLYKTGDLARLLPNGDLEYHGRMDDQVKIRGFRIELGEIEAALAQHEQVREAVVMVREDLPGDKRLVAYVVPEPGVEVNLLEVRDFLKANLPEYMIPAAVVVMDVFPLNPNGKVDRKVLPKPGYEVESAYVAPRTPEEQQMAAIWADVLGVEQVGVQDNFFDRGGHSLLATQVVSRLRKALQVEIPLRVLFESPTVAELAAWVEAQKQSTPKKVQPAMKATSREAFRKSKSSLNQK